MELNPREWSMGKNWKLVGNRVAEEGEGTAAGRGQGQGRSLSSMEAFPGCECSVSEPSLSTWGHALCRALQIRLEVELGLRANQEFSCEARKGCLQRTKAVVRSCPSSWCGRPLPGRVLAPSKPLILGLLEYFSGMGQACSSLCPQRLSQILH